FGDRGAGRSPDAAFAPAGVPTWSAAPPPPPTRPGSRLPALLQKPPRVPDLLQELRQLRMERFGDRGAGRSPDAAFAPAGASAWSAAPPPPPTRPGSRLPALLQKPPRVPDLLQELRQLRMERFGDRGAGRSPDAA